MTDLIDATMLIPLREADEPSRPAFDPEHLAAEVETPPVAPPPDLTIPAFDLASEPAVAVPNTPADGPTLQQALAGRLAKIQADRVCDPVAEPSIEATPEPAATVETPPALSVQAVAPPPSFPALPAVSFHAVPEAVKMQGFTDRTQHITLAFHSAGAIETRPVIDHQLSVVFTRARSAIESDRAVRSYTGLRRRFTALADALAQAETDFSAAEQAQRDAVANPTLAGASLAERLTDIAADRARSNGQIEALRNTMATIRPDVLAAHAAAVKQALAIGNQHRRNHAETIGQEIDAELQAIADAIGQQLATLSALHAARTQMLAWSDHADRVLFVPLVDQLAGAPPLPPPAPPPAVTASTPANGAMSRFIPGSAPLLGAPTWIN